MKKLALAIAVPLAMIGAATFYTSTQIESTARDAVDQANIKLREITVGSGAGISLKLLSLERGLLSSAARYQIDIEVHDEGETKKYAVLLQDRIEHGPFPASRLARGQLMPVAAQNHFQLERTPQTRKLFDAALGEVPLVGDVAIGYDGSRYGSLRSAAFHAESEKGTIRVSPGTITFDAKHATALRMDGELPEIDAILLGSTGKSVRLGLRGIGVTADKQEDANGFALGNSGVTLKRMDFQAGDAPAVVIQNASVDEVLKQGSRGLDQMIAYRIGQLEAQGRTFSNLALAFSLRNLEVTNLKALVDSYKELLESSPNPQDAVASMTDAQQSKLQAQATQLLEHKPTLALDEFGFETAHGAARLSIVLDLRAPSEDAFTLQAMITSVLASLKAEAGVDKSLLRDFADLIAQHEHRGGQLDPIALQQKADAATELISAMALNSGWSRLEGGRLLSSLHYADNQVSVNGREMSVPEFMGFAYRSIQDAGLLGQ
ncbi:YdgA family protein [Stutzerimonas nitrititolerans]|uniref:YdgA family protein n=1 Tax=Stutzerimonas nitrititolerans TaxID=2482751 RepID=UPI0028B07073|nr:YdgA family protein [Stutzerimonas nitrititolerans]